VNNDEIKLDDLIERSSLGTAGARLRRQRASKVRVESVVAAADEHPQEELDDALVRAVRRRPAGGR